MKPYYRIPALSAAAIGALMATTALSQAADLLPEPPVIIEQPPVLAPPPADDAGFYIRADVGISEFAAGSCIGNAQAFTGGIGAGYRFNRNFRSDVTLNYTGRYKPACQKIRTWTAMLNGYFDIPTNSIITPYLGVGIGWINVKSSTGFKDDSVAYAGMVGLTMKASQKVDVDLGYKYTYSKIEGSPNWKDHAVRVGLRLNMY
ncbi:MAG: hypothetical protein C0605_04995 [Hyphomicrobiales bacterium]|nr:MAG: hypothetical protein C0605_04995 [Hyphomicrobiales bacterium]